MEQLFGSKTRTKLLKLFLSNPNRSFYVREITRKIEEQINSVRRELANLLSLGVIKSDSTNNKLYYEVNQKYEHYAPLRELFTGKKTDEVAKKSEAVVKQKATKEDKSQSISPKVQEIPQVDQKIWDKVGALQGLLYTGVLTRDMRAPIDVLVVGDVNAARIETAISDLEKQENCELRYAIMDVDEWLYRKQINDKFWSQVIEAKLQIVVDQMNLFEEK